MKKYLAMLLMGSIIIGSLTACGGKVESTTTAEVEVTATSTEAVEPTTTPEPTPVAEEVVEETPEPEEFVLTTEYAEEKFNKFVEAYNDLVENGDFEALAAQRVIIDEYVDYPTEGFVIKDHENINDGLTSGLILLSTLTTYYYDYVNGDGKLFSFHDYLAEHTLEELACWGFVPDENYSLWSERPFDNAVAIYDVIKDLKIEFKEISEVTDNDFQIEYIDIDNNKYKATNKCLLLVDDKYNLNMLFDKDGNFIDLEFPTSWEDPIVDLFK